VVVPLLLLLLLECVESRDMLFCREGLVKPALRRGDAWPWLLKRRGAFLEGLLLLLYVVVVVLRTDTGEAAFWRGAMGVDTVNTRSTCGIMVEWCGRVGRAKKVGHRRTSQDTNVGPFSHSVVTKFVRGGALVG
jgi:hypothetical protein